MVCFLSLYISFINPNFSLVLIVVVDVCGVEVSDHAGEGWLYPRLIECAPRGSEDCMMLG
jgi:hypothetical protein